MPNNPDNDVIQRSELKMLLEIERIATKHNFKYYLAYGSALGAVRHKGFIPWDTDVDIIVDIDNYDRFCEILNEEIDNKYKVEHIDFTANYDSLKARMSLKGESNLITHIDIFPIVGLPENKILKKLFVKVSHFNYRLFFLKTLDPNHNYKYDKAKKRTAKFLKMITFAYPKRLSIVLYNIMKFMYPISKSIKVYNICGSYGEKEIVEKAWLGKPLKVKFEGHLFPIPNNYDAYLTQIYGDYMTPKKNNYV